MWPFTKQKKDFDKLTDEKSSRALSKLNKVYGLRFLVPQYLIVVMLLCVIFQLNAVMQHQYKTTYTIASYGDLMHIILKTQNNTVKNQKTMIQNQVYANKALTAIANSLILNRKKRGRQINWCVE